jgi:hypothetical protein
MNTALPLLATIVSLVFAALVAGQWWHRRRSFQLVWTAGLTWYGISTATEAWGSALGWSAPLYRIWFLFGAIYVAAWLGMGTFYLLQRTGFGYVVGVLIAIGGLFAFPSQLELAQQGHPAATRTVVLIVLVAVLAGAAVIEATAARRELAAHVAMAILLPASALTAGLTFTAHLAGRGYALDPHTQVPLATAVPPYLNLLTGPFNIAGAFCMIAGAIFSIYVYMPKHKLMRRNPRFPVLRELYRVTAVVVNLVASLPGAAEALVRGRLSSRVPATVLIAIGALVPSITTGLDRFGITWALYLGQLIGVVLIFAGFLVSEEVFQRLPLALPRPFPARQAPGTG